MAKKILEEEVLETAPEEKELAPVTANFGREDLNELRDLVNSLLAIVKAL